MPSSHPYHTSRPPPLPLVTTPAHNTLDDPRPYPRLDAAYVRMATPRFPRGRNTRNYIMAARPHHPHIVSTNFTMCVPVHKYSLSLSHVQSLTVCLSVCLSVSLYPLRTPTVEKSPITKSSRWTWTVNIWESRRRTTLAWSRCPRPNSKESAEICHRLASFFSFHCECHRVRLQVCHRGTASVSSCGSVIVRVCRN